MAIWCKNQDVTNNGSAGGRQGKDAGARLDPGLRAALEPTFGVDLSGLRLHSGPGTDAFLRSRGLAAAAYGHRIFLPAGSEDAGGERWLGMLAHEVAHAVQQAQDDGPRGAVAEFGADAAAAAFLVGRPVPARALRLPGPSGRVAADRAHPWGRPLSAAVLAPPRAGHGTSVLAGFNSWEHVLLGDLTPGQINSVAASSGQYQDILRKMVSMIGLWKASADVTPDQIRTAMDDRDFTVVTLLNGCVATYGEICALADYIADTGALETMTKMQMFPFLQQIRQETYNRLQTRLTGKAPNVLFLDAMYKYVDPSSLPPRRWVEPAREAQAIDQKTLGLGVNHYNGLLARNACHFAPFAWYRWLAARETAIKTAKQARNTIHTPRIKLIDLATAQLAYADHFLQDSFAAGHLTNKTLIMQYFLDWAAEDVLAMSTPVRNWNEVSQVTFANQPGLYGPGLYDDPDFNLVPNDPQTAEEQHTYTARMSQTGVVAFGTVTQEEAYHQYLSFLSATTAQLASNHVHNHFNEQGIKVVNPADLEETYLAYGDEKLLESSAQVGVMAPVLAGSKGTVDTVLAYRVPQDGATVLRNCPSMIIDAAEHRRTLKDWNTQILNLQAPGIFNEFRNTMKSIIAGIRKPSMGLVSTDQKGALGKNPTWSSVLDGTAKTPTSVLWDGQRLFAAANGHVFQLDPADGAPQAYNLLDNDMDVPVTDIRLASDGTVLYVGMGGHVVSLEAAGITQRIAVSDTLATGAGQVTTEVLLTQDGHLYASSLGYVYELWPVALTQRGYQELSNLGTFEARLAASPGVLVAGINHKIVCLNRLDISWVLGNSYGPDFRSTNVDVLTVGDNVWAAVGPDTGQVDLTQSGRFAHEVTCGPAPYFPDKCFDGDVRLATDGLRVYLSGFIDRWSCVRAVSLNDYSVEWTTNLLEMPGGTVANVLAVGANLFASSDGWIFQLDPETGHILQPPMLPGDSGQEVRMASDGVRLFCGITGYNLAARVVCLAIDPS